MPPHIEDVKNMHFFSNDVDDDGSSHKSDGGDGDDDAPRRGDRVRGARRASTP